MKKKIITYVICPLIGMALMFVALYIFERNPIIVSGSSMSPTYHDGELVVGKEYKPEDLTRGTVVVTEEIEQTNGQLIKRIVGIPGDTVTINNGTLYCNGQESEYNYGTINDPGILETQITLSDNEYFIMGDNRNASKDSRSFGAIDLSKIKYVID